MAAPSDNGKHSAIELAITQIERTYGKGSIMRMGDSVHDKVPVISSGSISVDHALGIGGIPRGRVIEIFGPESSGKTTLALHIAAEAQKLGGAAAFIDAEHALDIHYAQRLGINIDELLVSQPDTGEQALDIAETLIRTNAIDIVVIDSVAALVPKAEIDGDMGDSHMGLQARLMSQAMRKLTAVLNRSRTVAVFINQIREKIGVMFGSPETTPGGRALKFYASVRIDIRRVASIKDKNDTVGNRVKVKVVKNKLAPPFREAEFDIMFGEGISKAGDLIDLGAANKVIDKSGTWFTFADERLGQGRENAKRYLQENPAVMDRIEKALREELGLELSTAAVAAAEPVGKG
jgi:recombination protein RecA